VLIAGAWIAYTIQILQAVRLFQNSSCGTSRFAFLDLATFLGVTVWVPLATLAAVQKWRRRYGPMRTGIAAGLLCVVALYAGFVLLLTGWSHDDTRVAERFSLLSWYRVSAGMSREEVEGLLGPPIERDAMGGADVWVKPTYAGFYAAIWFEDGRVTKAQMWSKD
jgi:hypothetical protein